MFHIENGIYGTDVSCTETQKTFFDALWSMGGNDLKCILIRLHYTK